MRGEKVGLKMFLKNSKYCTAGSRKLCLQQLALSTCSSAALVFLSTVGLRGFGHDRSSGVATLHVARTRTNHSRGCATLQAQPGRQRRQRGNQHGDNNFNNLLLVHRNLKSQMLN